MTADQAGAAFDDITVVLENDDALTAGNETAAYDADTKVLTVKIDQTNSTAQNVIDAINSDVGVNFTAAVATGSTATGIVTTSDTVTLEGGVVTSGTARGAAFVGKSDSQLRRLESRKAGVHPLCQSRRSPSCSHELWKMSSAAHVACAEKHDDPRLHVVGRCAI